jgi:hypothetical protein
MLKWGIRKHMPKDAKSAQKSTSTAPKTGGKYSAESITVLEGLEPS